MAEEEQTTNAPKHCRERKPNFSDAEVSLLLEGVCKYKDLVNSTHNSPSVNRKREAAYRTIAENVNKASRLEYGGCVVRDWKEVRKKWTKEKSTALNIQKAKTSGNGQQIVRYGPEESRCTLLVMAILSGEARVGATDFRVGKRLALDSDSQFGESESGSSLSERLPLMGAVTTVFPAFVQNEQHGQPTPNAQTGDLQLRAVKTELNADSFSPFLSFSLDGVASPAAPSPATEGREPCAQSFSDADSALRQSAMNYALQTTGKTKQRKQNFTDLEISTLLKEVNKHRDVLFARVGQSSDLESDIPRRKQEQWMLVTRQVQKVCGSGTKRSVENILRKWRNLKTLAERERKILDKAKTKGRLLTLAVSPYTEQVLGILDGTLGDGQPTEVEEVDFDAMLNLDASSSHAHVLLHADSAQSPSSQNTSTAKSKPERKANFSHAEVMCLLGELPKHYKILGSKVRSATMDRLKQRHWQRIADKVNIYSDRDVVRTWKDVQRKFRKLQAMATRSGAKTRRGSESQETESIFDYDHLVLDILDGTSVVSDDHALEGGLTSDESDDGGHGLSFMEKNSSEERVLSAEERECLISEVEKFADVLFFSKVKSRGGHVPNDAWNQAWRMIAEKVSKCLPRYSPWKVKDMKEEWIELEAEAEHYQASVAEGRTDVTEPAHYRRMTVFLNAVDYKSVLGQPGAEKDGAGSAHSDTQPADSGLPVAGTSGQADSGLPVAGTSGQADQEILHNKTLKSLPSSQTQQGVHTHSSQESGRVKTEDDYNENSEEDDNMYDVQDPDYVPVWFKNTESNATTTSPSRMRKPINPKKFSRLVQLAPKVPMIQGKIRSPNFSGAEMRIILDVYGRNKAVLNCKKSDKSTNRKKLFVWQRMVNRLNKAAGAQTPRRTISQVRKKMKDIHSVVVKCWKGGEAAVRGRPPWMTDAVLEKLINMLDVQATDSDSFEIYKDIAGEEEDSLGTLAVSSGQGKATKGDNSAHVQKHLDMILHSCNQLQKLGVDAGALVFEDRTVMACGSERLRHHRSRPHLAALMAAQQNTPCTLEEQLLDPPIADDWDIITLGDVLDVSTQAAALVRGNGKGGHPASNHTGEPVSPVVSHSPHALRPSEQDCHVKNSDEDVNDESLTNADVPAMVASLDGEESDQAADMKEKHKAGPQHSSEGDSMVDLPKEELSEVEFTPVGFHLQQPSSSTSVYTCSVCQVSFPHLFLLMLHKQGHAGEEGEHLSGQEGNGIESDRTDVMGESHTEDATVDPKDDDADNDNEVDDADDGDDSPNSQTVKQQASGGTRQQAGRHATNARQRHFPCTFCGKTFFTNAHRRQHVRLHTGEKPFRCDVCGLRFTQTTSLTIHRRKHTGERPYACNLCDFAFYSSSNLLSHQKKRHGHVEKPHQQQKISCKKRGTGVGDGDDGAERDHAPSDDAVNSQTLQHQMSEGTSEQPGYNIMGGTRQRRYPCEFCDKRFFTANHLKQHLRIHSGERPYRCDVCALCFTQSTSLTIHKRKHTGERPYACGVCGYTFYSSSDLLSHRKKRHGLMMEKKQMQDKYKCEFCSREFVDIARLAVHRRRHTGEKPFTCDICQRGFSQKHNLLRHKDRHLGLRAFQCDICGAKFTEKGNLKAHVRYHTGEKPFKCEFCGEAFYISSTLKIHRRKHTGERPYLCDLCGASFTQGCKLKTHRRKHTGEKPYVCDECGEAYRDKQQLNIHQRKHTGVQPYTCGVCGKHLQKASHLANHLRLHTGEKPFACELCGEKFSRSDVLLVHRRKHEAAAQSQEKQPRQTTGHKQPDFSNQTHHQNQTGQPHTATQISTQPIHPNQNQQNNAFSVGQDGRVGGVPSLLPNVRLMPPGLYPSAVLSQVTMLPPGYQHL